jgi:hypothetical protein
MYELFLFWNNGIPILSAFAWGSNNARGAASALVKQDGYAVKATDPRYLSVGSFYINLIGSLEMSGKRCLISNRYNRVSRRLAALEAFNSWNATVASTWEPWGNRSGSPTGGLLNRLEIINCITTDVISLFFNSHIQGASSVTGYAGIAQNSTTVADGAIMVNSSTFDNTSLLSKNYNGSLGYSFYQALQQSFGGSSAVFGSYGSRGLEGSIFY